MSNEPDVISVIKDLYEKPLEQVMKHDEEAWDATVKHVNKGPVKGAFADAMMQSLEEDSKLTDQYFERLTKEQEIVEKWKSLTSSQKNIWILEAIFNVTLQNAKSVPQYYKEMSCAWLVMQKLASLQIKPVLLAYEDQWLCAIAGNIESIREMASEAICLTALKYYYSQKALKESPPMDTL